MRKRRRARLGGGRSLEVFFPVLVGDEKGDRWSDEKRAGKEKEAPTLSSSYSNRYHEQKNMKSVSML